MADGATKRRIDFLIEIDQLKDVDRASPILAGDRRENSAEHSWHLAMYALVLSDYSNSPVDIDRVIRMLLIHDIVEIYAGDVPIHGEVDDLAQRELEEVAAERLFGMLPSVQSASFKKLWCEFEEAQSADARFAKSLDRLQPLIQNVEAGGGTWRDHELSEQQVLERYGPQIQGGLRYFGSLRQGW